ncbi:MAG: indole-3-glycerol-phosphate synthase TrpC, partial [Lachnospiraceae bacterium]|nr:indole-3-glycerol-phosphate synthase TrpC [Lachnospiraceae bacterium]
ETSGALRQAVPDDIIFVAESGISTAEDVRALKQIGVDACLIGETLMRADDKGAKLRELDE